MDINQLKDLPEEDLRLLSKKTGQLLLRKIVIGVVAGVVVTLAVDAIISKIQGTDD